jgi:hypothetical protein
MDSIEDTKSLLGMTSIRILCIGLEWRAWQSGYRTRNQARDRFLPLYESVDERYTVYFPVVEVSGD